MSKARFLLVSLVLIALAGFVSGFGAGVAAAAAEEKPQAQGEMQPEGHKKGCGPDADDECPATFGPIITDTAVPIAKGKFAFQPTIGMSFLTGVFNKNWHRTSAGGDFLSFGMSGKFTYGLINNLEVYVVVPYVYNWANNVDEPGPGGERSASSGSLGDISVTFKYRLLEETETRPTVSFIFTPTFPTSRLRNLSPSRLGTDVTGGGAYVFTTGFNVSKYVKPFIFYGNLWYSMQTAFTEFSERIYPRDFVTVNLADEYPITKKWVALLEVTSFWDGGRLFGHKANTPPGALISVLPGIEFMATPKLSMALGVNVGLTGKNSEAAVTPVLSMVYAF